MQKNCIPWSQHSVRFTNIREHCVSRPWALRNCQNPWDSRGIRETWQVWAMIMQLIGVMEDLASVASCVWWREGGRVAGGALWWPIWYLGSSHIFIYCTCSCANKEYIHTYLCCTITFWSKRTPSTWHSYSSYGQSQTNNKNLMNWNILFLAPRIKIIINIKLTFERIWRYEWAPFRAASTGLGHALVAGIWVKSQTTNAWSMPIEPVEASLIRFGKLAPNI